MSRNEKTLSLHTVGSASNGNFFMPPPPPPACVADAPAIPAHFLRLFSFARIIPMRSRHWKDDVSEEERELEEE